MIAASAVQKPRAVRAGSRFAVIAPASPAKNEALAAGQKELERLGFSVAPLKQHDSEGYFASSAKERTEEFLAALRSDACDALIATRGGYGSVYLLDEGFPAHFPAIKPLVGFSDLTTLQIYLWQKHRWTGFYGPMLAAGLDRGAGAPSGYDESSFLKALTGIQTNWAISLQGEALMRGTAEGILLGG